MKNNENTVEETAIYTQDSCFENSSIWSKLTYNWVYPIMEKAGKQTLSIEDFKGLRESKRVQKSAENLSYWYDKLERKSLIKSIIKSFGREYITLLSWTFVQQSMTYVAPYLVYKIINWIQSDDQDTFHGLQLLSLFVGTKFIAVNIG